MDECLNIMRNTQKNIKESDIELFLYYNPDVAIQIVNDLIDEPNQSLAGGSINNAIDRETKHLAMRIKKCPTFKIYKQISMSMALNK